MANPGRSSPSRVSKAPDVKATGYRKQKTWVIHYRCPQRTHVWAPRRSWYFDVCCMGFDLAWYIMTYFDQLTQISLIRQMSSIKILFVTFISLPLLFNWKIFSILKLTSFYFLSPPFHLVIFLIIYRLGICSDVNNRIHSKNGLNK